MTTIKSKWEYGDIVYLRTDRDQSPCIVTGIVGRPGVTMIKIDNNGEELDVYDFQLSKDRDESLVLSGHIGNNDETED